MQYGNVYNTFAAKMLHKYSNRNSIEWNPTFPKSSAITHKSSTKNMMTFALNNTFTEVIKNKFLFMTKMKYNRYVMEDASLRLYLCCVELVDNVQFFEVLNLPDSFNSWFSVTELHLWLVCTQIPSSTREGQFLRKKLMKNCWKDVAKRMKLMDSVYTDRKKGLLQFSDGFIYNLYQYDEGLLGDDKALAAALWRGFFQKQPVDMQALEIMVQYVRKQLKHIEQYNTESLFTIGLITFLPLREHDKDDEKRTRQILNEITKRT